MTAGRWQIPQSWQWVEMQEISEVVGGGTPNASDSSNFDPDGTPWLTPADLSGYQETYISKGSRNLSTKGMAACGAKVMPEGAVLFTSRAPIGYVAIAANPIATNQGFKSFVLATDCVPEFFRYYLKSSKAYAESMASGSTFLELSGGRAKELVAPLAPTNEQRRIVAKLDALFEKSRSIREKLDRLPRLLSNLQKSILNSAIALQNEQAQTVPLRKVLKSVKTGPFGSSLHKSDYVMGGIPVINPMHITNGQITPSPNMSVTLETMHRLKEFSLNTGDVVIGRRGEMGRCAVVTSKENGWLCGTGSMVLTTSENLEPEYLQLFLSSPQTVVKLELASVGSTMVNLNQRILLDLEIPLPDIETQRAICQQVANSLEAVDRFSKRGKILIGKNSVLNASLLSKAFRGELVPQDPNDEPASVLLERIRAQKPAAGTKRGRGRKAAA